MADITGMLQAASGTGQQYVAVGHANSPYISVYNWSSNGFGSRFSNPATLPTSRVITISFHPAGSAIALGNSSSPYLNVYSWSSSGFGTRYTNPATVTGGGYTVAFHPSGNALATNQLGTSVDTSRGIRAYAWSSSGFGSKYTDPSFLATFSFGMDFHPSGNAIVGTTATTDPTSSLYAYSFSTSTGFGALASNTTTGFLGDVSSGVKFHPNGDAVGYVIGTSPFTPVYAWSSTGFGSKFADPSSAVPEDFGFGLSGLTWSPDGNVVAFSSTNSPYIAAYAWSNGFSSKYSDPALLVAGGCYATSFTPDGSGIALAHAGSPYITVYEWSNASGFGSKFSNPVTLPSGEGRSVTFLQT